MQQASSMTDYVFPEKPGHRWWTNRNPGGETQTALWLLPDSSHSREEGRDRPSFLSVIPFLVQGAEPLPEPLVSPKPIKIDLFLDC